MKSHTFLFDLTKWAVFNLYFGWTTTDTFCRSLLLSFLFLLPPNKIEREKKEGIPQKVVDCHSYHFKRNQCLLYQISYLFFCDKKRFLQYFKCLKHGKKRINFTLLQSGEIGTSFSTKRGTVGYLTCKNMWIDLHGAGYIQIGMCWMITKSGEISQILN